VDVLDDANSFFQISSIPSQPDGQTSFGFRLRRDGDFRIQTYSGNTSTLGEFHCDPGGPLTLWIDRPTATEFEFYYERHGERTLIDRATLPEVAAVEELYFGVQVFEVGGGGTTRFDNLRLGVIPEPATGSCLLFWLVMLSRGLRRKR
jgi:hypothetical protein